MRKTKPRKLKTKTIDYQALCNRAAEILDAPPALDWIKRPEIQGDMVAEFALPLDACQPQNVTRHAHWTTVEMFKNRAWAHMKRQSEAWDKPLSGRPMVMCVRFSSEPPDAYADWAKIPVDQLCCKRGRAVKRRLGIITDDSPVYIDQYQHWEPAPKGDGFCYIAIFSGAQDSFGSQSEHE